MSSMQVVDAVHRIVVVGMPGSGKSTVLNKLIDHFQPGAEVEKFEARNTGESCTKHVGQRILQVPAYDEHGQVVENHFVQLILVDTMGWPDTDPTKACDMYDEVVVDALNHTDGLTAVLWVVKGQRDDVDVLSKYKAFMTEISMVKCKIILLVNGQENYSDLVYAIHEETNPTKKAKLQEELDASRVEDRAAMKKIADTAANAVHPDNPRRFVKLVSTDKTELNKMIPFEIHRQIADQRPSSGNAVRTFEKMALAMASSEEALKQHKQDMAGELERLEKEKADAEWYNKAGLYGGGSAAGAVAAGTLYVTAGLLTGGVAWVAGAAAAAAATSGAAYAFVYDGHADEKAEELEVQTAKLSKKEEILTGAKLREENFKELCRFCKVDHKKYLENLKERKGLEQRHGA